MPNFTVGHMQVTQTVEEDMNLKQESRAIAKKARDAAAVRCGLKFADIHYKFQRGD